MHHQRLDEHLTELTVAASQLVLRGAGCAVTVLPEDGSAVVAASHDWAQAVEKQQLQYSTGPSIHAARSACTVAVDDWTRQGRQWPQSRRTALRVGVRSSVSLALEVGDAAAATSVHACEPNISRVPELSSSPGLAAFASSAITVALRADRLQREAVGFEQSLATAQIVNQAIGIVMARTRLEEALARLEGAACRNHTTPLDVAAGIICRTTGRRPDSDIHFYMPDNDRKEARCGPTGSCGWRLTPRSPP